MKLLWLITCVAFCIGVLLTLLLCIFWRWVKSKSIMVVASLTFILFILSIIFGSLMPKYPKMIKIGSEEYYQMLEEE